MYTIRILNIGTSLKQYVTIFFLNVTFFKPNVRWLPNKNISGNMPESILTY